MDTSKISDWISHIMDNALCVLFVPLAIIRHLWHLWCVLLSTLAVAFTVLINSVFGTKYTQYVEFWYDDLSDPTYLDFPDWYVNVTARTNNIITTFHRWLLDWICPNDKDDDDDWNNCQPQEVDEHEELVSPA